MEWLLILYLLVATGLCFWSPYVHWAQSTVSALISHLVELIRDYSFELPWLAFLIFVSIGSIRVLLGIIEQDPADASLIDIILIFVLLLPGIAGHTLLLLWSLLLPVFKVIGIGILMIFLPAVVVLLFRYIHYLMVPHPVEGILKSHRRLSRRQIIDEVGRRMYRPKRDGIPPEWQSENWRLRIEALTKRIKAEDHFLESLIAKIRAKSEPRR